VAQAERSAVVRPARLPAVDVAAEVILEATSGRGGRGCWRRRGRRCGRRGRRRLELDVGQVEPAAKVATQDDVIDPRAALVGVAAGVAGEAEGHIDLWLASVGGQGKVARRPRSVATAVGLLAAPVLAVGGDEHAEGVIVVGLEGVVEAQLGIAGGRQTERAIDEPRIHPTRIAAVGRVFGLAVFAAADGPGAARAVVERIVHRPVGPLVFAARRAIAVDADPHGFIKAVFPILFEGDHPVRGRRRRLGRRAIAEGGHGEALADGHTGELRLVGWRRTGPRRRGART